MKISSLSFLVIIIAASALTPAEGTCPAGGFVGGTDSWMASAQDFMNWDPPLVGAVAEKDVVLDVSSRRSPSEAHIRGAVQIPAKSFFYENGTLRTVSELAAILESNN